MEHSKHKKKPAPKPSPSMLGDGLAAAAGKVLRDRKKSVEARIKKSGG